MYHHRPCRLSPGEAGQGLQPTVQSVSAGCIHSELHLAHGTRLPRGWPESSSHSFPGWPGAPHEVVTSFPLCQGSQKTEMEEAAVVVTRICQIHHVTDLPRV